MSNLLSREEGGIIADAPHASRGQIKLRVKRAIRRV